MEVQTRRIAGGHHPQLVTGKEAFSRSMNRNRVTGSGRSPARKGPPLSRRVARGEGHPGGGRGDRPDGGRRADHRHLPGTSNVRSSASSSCRHSACPASASLAHGALEGSHVGVLGAQGDRDRDARSHGDQAGRARHDVRGGSVPRGLERAALVSGARHELRSGHDAHRAGDRAASATGIPQGVRHPRVTAPGT